MKLTPIKSGREGKAAWIRRALDEYQQPLVRYARRLLGDLEDSRDVVQETFLRLCREDPAKVDGHLAQWLYTVTRRRALDILRKGGRMQSASPAKIARHPSAAPSPHRQAEAREELSQVERALARLPEKHREVVLLKFQDGLSYREIGEITGLSESNVGFILHTALKRVRREVLEGKRAKTGRTS